MRAAITDHQSSESLRGVGVDSKLIIPVGLIIPQPPASRESLE
jgi:hypothetical protein